MRSGRRTLSRTFRAFTLIELLIVIAIIGLLAALLLPTLARAKAKGRQIACLSNVKEESLSMHIFVNDHDKYPWRVPVSEGGSQTRTRVSETFKAMERELATCRLLICPSDTRSPGTNFATLADTNVSYFIGIDTREFRSGMLLVGDRNLEGGRPNENCPVAQVTGVAVAFTRTRIPQTYWSEKQHRFAGNVSIGDGSAHQTGKRAVQEFLWSSGDDTRAFNNHILKP